MTLVEVCAASGIDAMVNRQAMSASSTRLRLVNSFISVFLTFEFCGLKRE
jgi:hypothetical protein